jgi:recombination protein RecA
MSAAVALLRAQLAAILAPAPSGEEPLATGVAVLDAALAGGIPRGRVTELVAVPGSGATTLVRRLVETTAARSGCWAAVVDATRTLAPRDWAHLGGHEGVWIIRPRDAARAAWCADVLLRSGAFALVVLDGAPPLTRTVAVRLERLAREHEVALVVVRDAAQPGVAAAPSALRLQLAPPTPGEVERVRLQVERGGRPRRVEWRRVIAPPRRLLRHPEPPDRRGTGRPARVRYLSA